MRLTRQFTRTALAMVATATLAAFSSSALADCADYSEARAKQAASALAKNPPKPAELGMPELAELTIDAVKSSGDPKCNPPEKRTTFFYKTSASLLDFYTAIFPYMKPHSAWTNPAGRESHDFFLTSGTRVNIRCAGVCKGEEFNAPGHIKEVVVDRRNAKAELTTGGPGWNWTAEDLAKGSPQPAAGRADRATTTAAAASVKPVATAAGAKADCRPPAADGSAAAEGATAGAEVGGKVLGGGYGRQVGSAIGGVLGALGGAVKKPEPAAPDCPR